MKIAFLVAKLEQGGLCRVNARIAHAIGRRAARVDLVTVSGGSLAHDPLGTEAPSVVDLGGSSSLKSVFRIRRALFSGDYDVVVVSQLFLGLVAIVARPRKSRTALVLVEHSSIEYWRKSRKIKDRIVYWISVVWAHRADQIVAVSVATRMEIESHFRKLDGRVRYLANPVLGEHEPVFNDWVRDASPRNGIIYVGRLSDEKCIDDIVRGFSLICDEVEDDLFIVGDGPLMNSLQQLARTCKIDTRVHFLGNVDDPVSRMRSARVLVLASRFEGLPTVLIEALSQECGVVSTDCPNGPREVLLDGEFGRLCDVGDFHTLGRLMLDASFPSERRAEIASHLSQFTIDKSAEGYFLVCMEVHSDRQRKFAS